MAKGTLTADFGAGAAFVDVAVTGQDAIEATSHVEAFVQGSDSTSDHSDYEHGVGTLFVRPTCVSITPGVGFTVRVLSDIRLTGTWLVRWVWA